MERVRLDNTLVSAVDLQKIAETLRQGGIVALPTDTVYGLVCRVDSPDAIQRIYAIKGREDTKPLPVFVNGLSQVNELADEVPEPAKQLMEKYWPGALTLIFPCNKKEYQEVTRSSGKIGLRMPQSPLVVKLIEVLGVPLASTSANLSSQEPAKRADEMQPDIQRQIELLVDGGSCGSGIASTIIDVSSSPLRIVRLGEITREELEQTAACRFQ